MNDEFAFEELIERHLRGELTEAEQEHLAERLDSDPGARREFVEQVQWDTRLAEVLRESSGEVDSIGIPAEATRVRPSHQGSERRRRVLRGALTGALLASTLALIAIAVGLSRQQPAVDPMIATITGINGPVQWTGDGGRVYRDLQVGTKMPGGTVEGLGLDAWFELRFNDGSTVRISRNAVLTFSDYGQKVLHLKEGTLSANVSPQPDGKPMLIHTRSAELEVVGTEFEVEAEPWSTILDVNEGKVRVERLSDGRSVEVPANYRVVAAADRDLEPVKLPDSVGQWHSGLERGPDNVYGQWKAGIDGSAARLKAVPFVTEQEWTIYALGIGVSCGDNPPVLMQPGSHIRVRGRMTSSHDLFVGMTVRQANGEFAGRFQEYRAADVFPAGEEFEITLPLDKFWLDPTLEPVKDKLPAVPFGLVVESVWCHSLFDSVGLEVTKMELIPPADAPTE